MLKTTLLIATTALFTLSACDELVDVLEPPEGKACTPGRVELCPCEDGNQGTQRCEEDGSGFDACACSYAEDEEAPPESEPEMSVPDPRPAPEPLPEVQAELRSAQIRVLVVGGTLAAEVNADWSATGTDGLRVELQVKSQLTYRAWTPILRDQPAEHFATASLAVTQGERRFDFRIVARDAAGNTWNSQAITIQ